MTDSSAPPGNSTPSTKPTTAPGEEVVFDDSAPATGKMPGLPPPLPPTNVTARPPGLPAPPLPGTAVKLPQQPQPQPAPPAPGEAPPPQGGPFHVHQQQPANMPPAAPPTRIPLRTIFFVAAALVAVVSIVLVIAFRPTAPKKARSIGARLDLAAGDVTVNDASGDVKALSGTPLGAGASVATAKGARALVRTGEGAAIFLRGETSLKLLERGVDVASGEVFLEAPRVDGDALECTVGAYRVSASDAGVSIKRDGKDLTVYVARGLAILTSPGGRVEITAGEQGVAKGEGKPTVTPVAFWQDWTGGMGDQRSARSVGSGTGRLYGLDPPAPVGAPARKLGIAKQVVKAVLRDGVAETEVDQTFSNPGSQPIEGWYWFTVPTTAMVTGFALETNGQLVEGEVIEKREAAAQYGSAMRQGNDPALLEWVDGRTYRARVYPIPASGTRRVVLRYIEMLPMVEGKTRYVYPLRSDDPVRFDEFALSVDVGGTDQDVEVASSLDARVEPGGRLVSMRRSGYIPRADFQLEIATKKKRAARLGLALPGRRRSGRLRDAPLRPREGLREGAAGERRRRRSSSTRPPAATRASRQLRVAAAESALRALSDQDHFALVTLDVAPTVVYPKEGLAPRHGGGHREGAREAQRSSDRRRDRSRRDVRARARSPARQGAGGGHLRRRRRADLRRDRRRGAPRSPPSLAHRLARALLRDRRRVPTLTTICSRSSRAPAAASTSASTSPGRPRARRSASRARSRRRPSPTSRSISAPASTSRSTRRPASSRAARSSSCSRARTIRSRSQVSVHGRIAGKDFDEKYDVKVDTTSVTASLVPRLWAAEYARRLMGSGTAQDDNRAQILQLGVEYGLITPFTSSLALDSEASYARQGIQRKRSRVRGVRLTAIERPSDEERLLAGHPPRSASDDDGLRQAERRSRTARRPVPRRPPESRRCRPPNRHRWAAAMRRSRSRLRSRCRRSPRRRRPRAPLRSCPAEPAPKASTSPTASPPVPTR